MGWEWRPQVADHNTSWEAQGEAWGMLLADALVTADSSVTAGSITADLRTAISFGTTTTLSSFLILHRSGSPGGGEAGGGEAGGPDTLTPIMITVPMITDRRPTTNTGED
jgi:hypothetical protein